jgi:hypothetical protein
MADRAPAVLRLTELGGASPRWWRDRIHDPVDPLPAFRLGRCLVVRPDEFDRWLARRRVTAPLDALVDEVLRELAGQPA